MTERFQRLAVLGVGLLGGAIGRAARSAGLATTVAGYCRREEACRTALAAGTVDECFIDPLAAARGADLAVLAVGPESVADLAGRIAPALADGAIVTDVASVKSRVVAGCTEALGRRARFVGAHPLAGSEKRGAEHSAEVRLAGALCVLTPCGSTDRAALAAVRGFWEALGMRVLEISPEEHDARLARTSHLPHLAAAALAVSSRPGDEPFCATGWRDTTRVASGDPAMWTEIAMSNREALAGELYRLARRVQDAADLLTAGDAAAVRRFLEAGAARRAEVLGGEPAP
ncbi:MAG TPA: prephenate dehydrogenase [Planctomycetota bacterium]|nr:prephenate dehydrogenase [Planctomycetota bacterium]